MATFKIYSDRAGEYRWTLRSANGKTVADSAEGYTSRQGARDGVAFVKANAATANVEEV